MNNRYEFKIVSEFPKFIDENEECGKQDFGGDAYGYHVKLNDDMIVNYGDNYHDKGEHKGEHKCEAFIDGWLFAKKIDQDFKIKYVNEVRDDD